MEIPCALAVRQRTHLLDEGLEAGELGARRPEAL
ncbi:hypothetical protein ABIA39_003253 [Nocardia sp. GAS34]